MPRKPRQPSASGYYHFINRGVNKKKIFHEDEDFEFYKGLLKEYAEKLNLRILHYCLMANHTHLLLWSEDILFLSQFGHFIQRRYAYYYCKTYHWSEQVFRNRYMSLPVENDSYLLECGRYIERNPLDANIVKDPKEYKHSSFHYYAYGKPDNLVTQSPLYHNLGRSKEERMLVYRFNIIHSRSYELEKNKPLRKVRNDAQPVPF